MTEQPSEGVARLDRALALFQQGMHELRLALREEPLGEGLVPIAQRVAARSGRVGGKKSRRGEETTDVEAPPTGDTTDARVQRAQDLKAAHEQSAAPASDDS